MEEHVKLRLEYKKLIREGKEDNALKVLKKIWSLSGKSNKSEQTEESKVSKPKSEVKKKVNKILKLSDLKLINGIGNKVLNDIYKQFDTMEELIDALVNDKVALRDDIVEKLKEVLLK